MVHKNQNIPIVVKDLRVQADNYLSLIFERPKGFIFESGDWIDLQFADASLRGGKTYSIASSPTEPDIMITFREGLSPLKQALASVKPSDKLKIIQYGNDYGFTLQSKRASTLIAGGVGIAPFRSMLKELADNRAKTDTHLIYLNKNDDFLFKDELDEWQDKIVGLNITYISTDTLKRKDREKILNQSISDINRQFYIAGPPGMVTSTEKFLTKIGVNDKSIKLDIFGGY